MSPCPLSGTATTATEQVARDLRCPCGEGQATLVSLRVGGDVITCRTCGLLSRWPLPPEAELDAYYRDGYWAQYEAEQQGPARHNVYLHALDCIERFRKPPGVLVDVGCGPGALLALSRDRGWDAIGVEPSASAVAQARAQGLNAIEGTWLRASLKPESADVMTFINVLDHMPDPFAALEEARRVLRPGGLVYLRVPNGPVHAWLIRMLSRVRAEHLAVLHAYGFGRRALRHHLSRLNFTVRLLRAAPPSQHDAYRGAGGRTCSLRAALKALNRLGHRVVTVVGLDRCGWGLALEVVATRSGDAQEHP